VGALARALVGGSTGTGGSLGWCVHRRGPRRDCGAPVGAPAGASEGAPVGAPAVGAPVGAPARALVGALAGAPCTGGRALWWKQPWWEPRWGPCPPPGGSAFVRSEHAASSAHGAEFGTPKGKVCVWGTPRSKLPVSLEARLHRAKAKAKAPAAPAASKLLEDIEEVRSQGRGWDLGFGMCPRATRSIADGCRTPACSRREGPPTSRRMPIYVRKKTGRGAYWYWLVLNEPIIRGLACVIAYLVLSTGPGALKQPAQAIASGAQALTLP
jgi:hypothetical protein